MIGFYFIQDKYRYTISNSNNKEYSSNNKEKELNIINQENESLLTKKKNVTNNNIKIIYKKILNYIFLS